MEGPTTMNTLIRLVVSIAALLLIFLSHNTVGVIVGIIGMVGVLASLEVERRDNNQETG